MTPRPVRAVALGDQLADLLRFRIVTGELSPGTHLVEDTLAVEHDVSRGPVRDALRILQGEGLIEGRRRGLHVRGFTRADIDELYDVRESLEQLAGRLAITKAAADGWALAERPLLALEQAADDGDQHAFAEHDLEFHSAFYALASNVRLAGMWGQLRPTFAALLDVTNAQDKDLHPAAADHRLLLDLARRGDTAAYATALTSHLDGSRRRMVNAMASEGGLAADSAG